MKKTTIIIYLLMAALAFSQDFEKDFEEELNEDFNMESPSLLDMAGNEDGGEKEPLRVILPRHQYDLNPWTSQYNTETQIISGLYEGVYTSDPATGEPILAVAKSVRVSRNGLRWTFVLKDDLKFSDGSPLTALDVRRSWLGLLSTKGAPYSSLLDMVVGAKDFRLGRGTEDDVGLSAIDNSVILELTAPAAHLPKILCMSCFSVVGSKDGTFSGAWVLDHINESEAVLTPNKNYIGAEKIQLGKIIFLFSDDEEKNSYLYNTGEADWIAAGVDVDKLLDKSSAHIMAEFGTEFFFFCTRDNIWRNAAFREALLTAVPYEKLREKTFVPATTLVYPVAGYPGVNGWSAQDSAVAKDLMKGARASYGIKDTILPLTIAALDSERGLAQAQLLKEAWDPLGLDITIKTVPSNEYLKEVAKGECDIYSYTWIGDYFDPLAFLELFRGGSTLNVARYKNTKFDEYLDRASKEFDPGKRLMLLSLAEGVLLDDCEILPVQHPVSLNVLDLSAVGGWVLNSFDLHPLKYIYKKEKSPAPIVPGFVLDRPKEKNWLKVAKGF